MKIVILYELDIAEIVDYAEPLIGSDQGALWQAREFCRGVVCGAGMFGGGCSCFVLPNDAQDLIKAVNEDFGRRKNKNPAKAARDLLEMIEELTGYELREPYEPATSPDEGYAEEVRSY